MDTEKIKADVRQFLIDELGIDDDISFSDKLFSTGLMDSLDVVNLKTHIEKSYSLKFSALDITLDTIDSVDNICAFILKKKESET